MFSKTPRIQVDKIEHLDITIPFHPYMEHLLSDYLHHLRSHRPDNVIYKTPAYLLQKEEPETSSTFLRILDYFSKGISVFCGIVFIALIILIWIGQVTIGNVQITTLLTVMSFTLVGGIISIGGVKLFSINANLRRAKEKVTQMVSSIGGCPFVNVVDEETKQRYGIINSYEIKDNEFCSGCRLVDFHGKTVCTVSPFYRD